jgi:signal transduction histidine kinase
MSASVLSRDGAGVGVMDARGAAVPPRAAVLWAIALAGVGAAACTIVLRLTSDHGGAEPGLQAALLDWIVCSYILSGLIAWWRRPDSRLGPLMVAGGFLTALSSLSSASAPLALTIGLAADLVPFAVFLHVYLAFPTGVLEGRVERALVVASYSVAVGLQLIQFTLGGLDPDNVLALVSEPELAATVGQIQLAALAAISLCGVGVLVARGRAGARPLRRSAALLVDSFCLALVMMAMLLITGAFFPEESFFLPIQRATFVVIGLAPVAFLIALLDARLARSAVGELMIELHGQPSPIDLREPLARALHDPSVRIAYWLPQYAMWTDSDGRPVRLAGHDDERGTTLIERDGEPIAVLEHDPALKHEPELLDAVSASAAIALENGRLQAELRARLEELRGSRGRVIEAGQRERERLERNLHDGAQQRLIALSLELGRLGTRLRDDPEAQARIDEARREIAVSLDELRTVARGLHPAVLTAHGLPVAVESLAATSAVPVRLDIALDRRVDEQAEVAAYYVVCETLANIGKHAQAESAAIRIAREHGDLVVEVLDDGVGGADTESGSGLRGLADRVEALGGRLQVWTPRGGGTRVRAQIPCA